MTGKRKYFNKFATIAMALVVFITLLYFFIPHGPRDPMAFYDTYGLERPTVRAKHMMAATGTPWATEAALDIMEQGANAIDAAVAALLVLNVTYGEAASFPGVAPVLVYTSVDGRVRSYTGTGTAPQKATIEFFRKKGHDYIPKNNILAQLIPASPDVIIALLKKQGTMSFHELSAPAIKIAREGFPIHMSMMRNLDLNIFERLGFRLLMPYNVDVYLQGQWWRPLHHKDRFKRPHLAKTLDAMAQAERDVLAKGGSRLEGLKAVRDYFYKGPIAEAIVKLHRNEGGLITREDLSKYSGYWESPLSANFGDFRIFSNDTWSQGAVVLIALKILENMDVKSMKHNSPEYIHAIVQAIELAMADRDKYFGDPKFVHVPIEGLLSKEYAVDRKRLMTLGKAFGKMPPAGIPPGADRGNYQQQRGGSLPPVEGSSNAEGPGKDTSYISVIDPAGNAVSLTPSDFPQSPMVPGTGLTLGIRMTQFRLDSDHPSSLKPGKRPTITPNAAMAFYKGRFFMAFGTPGGDMQTQALVQVFLNIVVFGMDIQKAIDAPRVRSYNWPDAFSPHEYRPGVIAVEEPLYSSVADQLEDYGYKVEKREKWDNHLSAVCVIVRGEKTGELMGGADPRENSWAEGR